MACTYDLVCLSHLRWDFVYQRPQHLLHRFARERRVFYVEEPVVGADRAHLAYTLRDCGVWVVVPHLPSGLTSAESDGALRHLIDRLFIEQAIDAHVLWYYTPMAIPWTNHLEPVATVYDCMDELSAFHGASSHVQEYERQLFARADLVFTGGQSLYDAKRNRHPAVLLYPSSVDVDHFARARTLSGDPDDQRDIPHPRLGFYGVIDERMDVDLLAGVAEMRPDWQIIMVGPIVKIDPATLPRHGNIHFLGPKAYAELPAYLAGWDVALLPFARNASTRFISPTKTPEYLASGKPVVSTSITDVVRPYGEQQLVAIADTPAETVAAIEMLMSGDPGERIRRADAFLARTSWEKTWCAMATRIDDIVRQTRGWQKAPPELIHLRVPAFDPAAAT
jgi:UDP-galactopyranose mutase